MMMLMMMNACIPFRSLRTVSLSVADRTEVMVLKRDDLLEVAREFEQADRQLRRAWEWGNGGSTMVNIWLIYG